MWSGDIDPDDPTTWTSNTFAYIGRTSSGRVTVDGDSYLRSYFGFIGYEPGSTGEVTVDGAASTWTIIYGLFVGYYGSGTMNITNGGAVINSTGYIGDKSGSTGVVTVDGTGSMWTNTDRFYIGHSGSGTLNITGGGLVSVAGTLSIDYDSDGNGFINMATGGMLALYGNADDSLADFLGLIDGTDAIRYWDYPLGDWDDIINATYGEDYTLTYYDSGDLAGYTVLTVPEPATLPGDANGDGWVGGDDLTIILTNWGMDGQTREQGDLTGEGFIGGDDYTEVLTYWGTGIPPESVITATPEPATLGLLLLGGLAMLRRRRLD